MKQPCAEATQQCMCARGADAWQQPQQHGGHLLQHARVSVWLCVCVCVLVCVRKSAAPAVVRDVCASAHAVWIDRNPVAGRPWVGVRTPCLRCLGCTAAAADVTAPCCAALCSGSLLHTGRCCGALGLVGNARCGLCKLSSGGVGAMSCHSPCAPCLWLEGWCQHTREPQVTRQGGGGGVVVTAGRLWCL